MEPGGPKRPLVTAIPHGMLDITQLLSTVVFGRSGGGLPGMVSGVPPGSLGGARKCIMS